MRVLIQQRNLSKLFQIPRMGETTRSYHDTNLEQHTSEPQEIKIKVPWGHIAGKWWGSRARRPILCIHGWQDNCGSFDTLIPLLPKHVGMLAIDMPGHGLSSRIPNGMAYYNFDTIMLLKLISKIYNWDKISIMAHSLGSVISFVYAGLYPKEIDMFIAIDALKPHMKSSKDSVKSLARDLTQLIVADGRNRTQSEPPSYFYDEMVEKLHIGTFKSISKETAHHILNRAVAKSEFHPDKYYFTRDSRLKNNIATPVSQEVCVELAKRMKFPYLFVKAKNSPYYEDEKYHHEVLDILKENNNLFEHHLIDSSHHLHLTSPQLISGIISDFINKYRPLNEKETINSKL